MFVDQVAEDNSCPICLLVLRDPGLTECCGHNFCQSCIKRVQYENGPCPRCKATKVRTVNNRQLRNRIVGLKIHCKYYQTTTPACDWTGTIESLEGHLSEGRDEGECQFVPLKCRFGCGQAIERAVLQQHLNNECPKRPAQCEYCGIEKTHEKVLKHHKICSMYPVTCPNQCSTTTFQRCHLKKHLHECPLEEIRCEFSLAGCSSTFKRQDAQEHMSANTQVHLSLLVRQLNKQQKSNKILRRKYVEIEEELRRQQKSNQTLKRKYEEMQNEFEDHKRQCESSGSDCEYDYPSTPWWQ